MMVGVIWVVVEFNLVVLLQILLLIFIIINMKFLFCFIVLLLLPVRNIQKCVFS